ITRTDVFVTNGARIRGDIKRDRLAARGWSPRMNRSRTAPACSNPYDARRTSCSRDRVESVDGVALPIDASLLGLDRMLQLAFRRVVESGCLPQSARHGPAQRRTISSPVAELPPTRCLEEQCSSA